MKFPITMLISKEMLEERFNVHDRIVTAKGEALDAEVWYIYNRYTDRVLLVRQCDAEACGLIKGDPKKVQ